MNRFTRLILLLFVALACGGFAAFLFQKKADEGNLVASVVYSCNAGKTISASFYNGESLSPVVPGQPPVPNGKVKIVLSDGRAMTLRQTISGSGVRYANPDEAFVFWNKGNGALVLENNKEKNYIGCIEIAPAPKDGSLPRVYSNSTNNFSLRLPPGYVIYEKYIYQALGPGKDIAGVKFTIPSSVADGTNLGHDSYLSVERIPQVQNCSANLFLDSGAPKAKELTENDVTYSFASSTGAGAGNRYEETVYAIPGTNPCLAVRYFIHYSVFENYPPGTVKEFDRASLLKQFDEIRSTLVVD